MCAKAASARQCFQPFFFCAARLLSWCFEFFEFAVRLFGGSLRCKGASSVQNVALLSERLRLSQDYSEWADAAAALDAATGHASWRTDYSDGLLNTRVLEQSMSKMRQFRAQGDVDALLRLLQPCVSRTHCGINNEKLFRDKRPALGGSKKLFEDFEREIVSAISFVADQHCKIGAKEKLQWMLEARHAHGKTALLLSGGASFGLYHLGVVKALHRAGLLPKILAGSSAGSIMAAMVATRTNDQELEDLFDGTFSVQTFSAAFDQKGSLRRKMTRVLTTGRLFDIGKLSSILRTQLGDITFLEAFKASGRVLNVTVSPASSCDSPMLLNHITAPDVLVWSACRCKIIYLQSSVHLTHLAVVLRVRSHCSTTLYSCSRRLQMARLFLCRNRTCACVTAPSPLISPMTA